MSDFTNEIWAPHDDEGLWEYICRLANIKQDWGITWGAITEVANSLYNKHYDESTYRKYYNKKIAEELSNASNSNENLNEDAFGEEYYNNEEETYLDEINNKLLEIEKMKIRMRDQRMQTNANIRRLAREDTIREIAIEYANIMNKEKMLDLDNVHYIEKQNKTAILNVGDWHYGIETNLYWNSYNTQIARERVTKLVVKTIEKCKANNVTKLIVNGMGDYISGLIHLQLRVNNQEDVISQIMDVSEIIAEMLNDFSKYFVVEFYNVYGNHARINPKKVENIQLENLERIVGWYLKQRLFSNLNVHIIDNEYDDDMTIFETNGWTIGAVHGDKDKVTNVVKNLTLMTSKKFDLIITAHKHHFAAEETNDCIVISNPSLCGMDEYAKDLRASATPAQTLIIIGETHPVECIYYIDLA